MIANRHGIAEGMPVYSSDNEKVGKVIRLMDSGFEIEKGFFFPKDYLVSYSDINRNENGYIYLNLTKAQLKDSWDLAGRRDEGEYGTSANLSDSRMDSRAGLNTTEEIRVPVAEEELDVLKRERETGAVRVTKEVISETKTVNVPVTREEVHVERVPVNEARDLRPGEAAFKEGTVTVPIHEEEVEIHKRPVVKEEVRISKESHREDRKVRENVRKEKVDVDESATYNRRPASSPELRAGSTDETWETDRLKGDRDLNRDLPINDPNYKKF